MIDFIVDGDSKFAKKKVKGRYGDNCLFCGKSFPEVDFKNAPHLLSKMIGSSLYSDFECDNCNKFFHRLETDFSHYLGISRSLSGLHKERKTPGFPGIGINVKTLMFRVKKFLLFIKKMLSEILKKVKPR